MSRGSARAHCQMQTGQNGIKGSSLVLMPSDLTGQRNKHIRDFTQQGEVVSSNSSNKSGVGRFISLIAALLAKVAA